MTELIKYLDIKEFRSGGYLQEVNRRFFHPLGLAMEIVIEDNGTERLGGIWDYRDDPEGMLFATGVLERDKASKIAEEWLQKAAVRSLRFGFVIQGIDDIVNEMEK